MDHSPIDREALYTAGIDFYRSPDEPKPGDRVRLRFRVRRQDVDGVYLSFPEEGTKIAMEAHVSDHYFDYYETEVVMGEEERRYVFLIEKGEECLLYNRLGVTEDRDPCYAFRLIPDFHIPDWLKGALMYQIFIDRFRNGDPKNDVVEREYSYLGHPAHAAKSWESPIEKLDVYRFYGGDLQGVLEKLDYLSALGIRAIYFNPLFVSPSNHKYDTQDYEHIDPHIACIVRDGGSELPEGELDNHLAEKYRIRTTDPENLRASDEYFASFIAACHERGIRVIIDGVFNHCGSFSKWMNRSGFYSTKAGSEESGRYEPGAFESKESPYHSYFSFADDRPEAWPNNESYEKWWGNDTLPKLNYEDSEALENRILEIAKRWVSPPFSCDGWRLDVAADLGHSEDYNHRFWQKFRRVVKEANPEAVILAEHYGDPQNWLNGREWDTVMNYDAFMEPVSWFLTGVEKHSDTVNPELRGDGESFFLTMSYNMAKLPENSVLSAMNQLSNHDHSRFMTRTNQRAGRIGISKPGGADEGIRPEIYRLGAMIQMSWPGAPTLYYGDEVGMCGWTEPDSRRPFPWGKEDLELLEYHQYLSRTHRYYKALTGGSLMPLMAGREHIVYARLLGDQVVIVAINSGPEEYALQIPIWRTGLTDTMLIRRVLKTDRAHYNAGETKRYGSNGFLRSYMQPYTGKIYVAELK